MRQRTITALAGTVLALSASAGVAMPRPPGGGAVTGLRLVLPDGKTVENATLLFRDGRIVAAGASSAIRIPADVLARDGSGLTAYPGLIEMHDPRLPTGKAQDAGNFDLPADSLALLDDPARNRKLREAGFVASLVSNGSGILRGEGTLATLADGDAPGRVLARNKTQHVAMKAADEGYPASIMGAVAGTRQAFADSLWLTAAGAAYALDAAQSRPHGSVAGTRLRSAARGQQPVVFEADDPLASLRAAALAKELRLDAWIAGSGREYRHLEAIRESGLPQILPLRFPEKPKAPAEGERGPELDELREWALAPENPARVLASGLPVALTTFRLDEPRAIHAAVARAIEGGLTREQALAALSRTPAKLLGVGDRWGALAPGQSASFVLVEGELFVDAPKIREVWIEGERFEISSRGDDASAKAEVEEPAEAKEVPAAASQRVDMEAGVDPTAAWRSTAPDRPEAILVKGATIWTSGPRGRLENADLLVRNGRIAAVGENLRAPAGATILEANGRHVTPGIIDAHSHSAIDGSVNEGTNIVTAEVRIADVIDPDDVAIYRELAGGLTVANLLHGSANAIGGQNAVVKLRWGAEASELLFAGAPSGIKLALGENPKQSNWQPKVRRFPQTRMGVEQAIRASFLAARDYRAAWKAYDALGAKARSERVPPRRDYQLEAVAEIFEGRRLVHAHSYRADEILMLIDVADEFGVKIATFQHVLEGYKVADEIARHGAGASGFSDWWTYKYEVIDAIPWNGAILHQRGVVTSFNSDSNELARRLNLEAAKAVRYGGLPEEEALQLVTINPAKQLGIEDRVGSLEPGKDADFVIWSGSPLSTYSRAEQTWIDGRKYFDRDADLAARERLERERLARLAALATPAEKKSPDAAQGTPEEVKP